MRVLGRSAQALYIAARRPGGMVEHVSFVEHNIYQLITYFLRR